MHVLVTGGAGYVGSNVVHALREAGHRVTVLDDLSSGHRAAVPAEATLLEGGCGDPRALAEVAAAGVPDGIMHMAARCSVGESMEHPRRYYRTNVRDSLLLMDWAVDTGVGWFLHSSTCAVYGIPGDQPMDESLCERPINAYGASKATVDQALRYYEAAYRLRAISLRYFNAAGAQPDGTLGEDKTPASNLVPAVLNVALGQRQSLTIFGSDYETPDGTGVRDYIHVRDLAAAHLAAMERLGGDQEGGIFNLGTGRGHSVLDVVRTARRVTGHPIPTVEGERRSGDPPSLVAVADRARSALDWTPRRSDIETMLRDAWCWHQRHPRGYAGIET